MHDTVKRVDIVVSLWIDANADAEEVVQEMDYCFDHVAIDDCEIIDIKEPA